MTKKITSVQPHQKLIDVKHIFEKKDFHHHIPVIENDELKGIISLVDFLFAIKEATLDDSEKVYHELTVKDIMKTHPVTITEEATLRDACKILEKGDVHALIVCKNKTVKGILSTTDILSYFLSEDLSNETD